MIVIQMMIFDVDGVFTDGKFIYDERGKKYKSFGAHDADGINLLKNSGIIVQAITADKRGYSITEKRMHDMNIPLNLVSENERNQYICNLGTPHSICFMGDGHYDAQIFKNIGYSIAPANAVEIAKKNAKFVTKSKGGNGAVYEACLHVLEKTGKL